MSARRPGRSARFSERASGSPARGVQLRRERKPEDRRVRNVRHLTSFCSLSQPTTGGEALRSIKNSHLRQTQNMCDTGYSPARAAGIALPFLYAALCVLASTSCCTVLLLGIFAAAPARAGTGMFVGAAEDESRKLDPLAAKSKLDLAAVAGLGTIRMTSIWSPGETVLRGDELIALRNASTAAQFDGVRLIVSIYPRDRRTTPLNARARGEFAQYAASVARLVPGRQGLHRRQRAEPEPVLDAAVRRRRPRPRGAVVRAAAREDLRRAQGGLAGHQRDRRRALAARAGQGPKAARQTHSPTAFITDLGLAYRKSGRTRPIMDMFAMHPYLIPSKLRPTFAHPNTTTIGLADYPKLVALLTRAFARTAQAGATLPIIYDEFGYQSRVADAEAARSTRTSARPPRRMRSPSRARRSTTSRRSRSRAASRRSPGC